MSVTFFPQECPDCNKPFRGKKCPSCGWNPSKAEEEYRKAKCPVDGGEVMTDGPAKGFCIKGGGYPTTIECPFVCPICRHELDWTGGCFGCHGGSDRETWAFPGDGYYTHDEDGAPLSDGLHYVKVTKGPRGAWTMAANVAGARNIVRLVKTPLHVGGVTVADAALGPQP